MIIRGIQYNISYKILTGRNLHCLLYTSSGDSDNSDNSDRPTLPQGQGNPPDTQNGERPQGDAPQGNPVDSSNAVSYTHLDVYKRQSQENGRVSL